MIANASNYAPISLLCTLAGVSRSGYYRSLEGELLETDPLEMDLRDQIQRISLEMPRYGYRRVTRALRRSGYQINHKRVLRLLRKRNLLCIRHKRWVRTTDSRHRYRVYPDITRRLALVCPNQLWVADITYVRLLHEFVYLAVILDAFSRRAIGWALSRHIDTNLSLSALEMALETRTVTPGLIHHSDQGVQYAADEYTELLKTNNIAISMARKGNPYDNAKAESFIKTLKYEEVLINEYETFQDAYKSIRHFIEIVYNQKRLHSSLNYLTPVELEKPFNNSLETQNSPLLTV
jgi:transposase InsO family protein